MTDTGSISTTRHEPRHPRAGDTLAVLALVALWLLYFWRILTPQAQDSVSLVEGDFSGQFVAFFGYQVERLSAGEVPLWNPYNNAGHPFLADTQAAVFYPPRLLTVALVSLRGDTSPGALYGALQLEMALHVLLGTLLMYAFVRRVTARGLNAPPVASVAGGLVAAVTFGYGGYLSGYPQLQLAILEAGVWLPLILLALFEATRTARPGWPCLMLAAVGMGLSLLAGHPQTSLFTLYVALAFLAYRLWRGPDRWREWVRRTIAAGALFGILAGALAAVQLLPGLEYLEHTTRTEMGFDAKGNGFPFSDLVQAVLPSFLTLFSPLYFGIAGLVLALWAVGRRVTHSAFFGVAALLALGLSFGAGTVLYDVGYLLLPGLSWFRGQERAVFVVAQGASVLTGLGTADLLGGARHAPEASRTLRRGLCALLVFTAALALVLFVAHLGTADGRYRAALGSASFAALLALLSLAVLPRLLAAPATATGAVLLLGVVVFDLFSVTMGTPNYEPVPAHDRLPTPAIARPLREALPPGARVDAARGLRDNFGTLYAVPDIRGISPLRLEAVARILDLPDARTWDLLAVRYVLTDWNELPVPSTIIARERDPYGAYNVHELDNPRGFAHLTYGATVVAGDAEALGLLREASYDTRQHVILDREPDVDLPGAAPLEEGRAEVTHFAPEAITARVEVPAPAILTLALPHYPGWDATLDGAAVDLLRAYGGLSAVALPGPGSYTLTLTYQPWTFRLGAALSAATWLGVAALTVIQTWRHRRESSEPAW